MAIIPTECWSDDNMFPQFENWFDELFEEIEMPLRIRRMKALLDTAILEEKMTECYQRGLFLPIEQCCDRDGQILGLEIRETRLAKAPNRLIWGVEDFLRNSIDPYLTVMPLLIYWLMRRARAATNGSPELMTPYPKQMEGS